jgi:pilus assembly protein CpaE
MTYTQGLLDVVVITVGTDEEFIAGLMRALESRAWNVSPFHLDSYISAARRPSMGPRIKSAAASIALVDYDRSPDEAAETTRYLTQTFGGKVLVIAVASAPTATTILSAMRAGCSELISTSQPMPTLETVLDRIESLHEAELEQLAKRGSIQAVLGAKGGAGATTLAVHLAVYLAKIHHKRTLLIDQHVELGHACVYLGIDGAQHHLSEVVRNLGRMDSELLQGFVAKHKSGLDVLSSPDSAAGGLFHAEEIASTLEYLRGEYDYIVVDCDRSQPELNPAMVDAATQLYVVGTPEIAAIRDLSRTIDKLLVLDNAAEKLQVALNRFNTPYSITVEQIERAMRLPVSVKVPNDYPELVRAANVGEPIMPDSGKELAASFMKWAEEVVGAESPRQAKRGERKLLSMWRQTLPAW